MKNRLLLRALDAVLIPPAFCALMGYILLRAVLPLLQGRKG